MMLYREIGLLHEYSPYWLLRLWGSSDRLVALSRRLYYGGGGYRGWEEKCRKMERWPLSKIEEFQLKGIQKLVRHCYENVPYYSRLFKKLGLLPSDIRCLEDLEKLPVLTKNDVLDHYPEFFARNMSKSWKYHQQTSGTTGRPAMFYRDEGAAAAFIGSCDYFGMMSPNEMRKTRALIFSRWAIWSLLYRRYNPIFSRFSPVTGGVYVSDLPLGDSTFELCARYIKKFNIQRIYGFPSAVYAFAKYVERKNLSTNIKAILCGSEILYEGQRSVIEKAFGCEVFDWYTSSECVVNACECEKHAGLHITPFSVVNIDPSKVGKAVGRIVFTSMASYLMPLLRYTAGDVGSITYKRCACGRSYPRLRRIEGRTNDFVILPNGQYIHPVKFYMYPVEIKGIEDIYFLQHEDYSMDISVVKEKGVDKRELAQIIGRRFSKTTRGVLPFSVRFTDAIRRSSKKYRIVDTKVVSDLNMPRKRG